MNIKLTTGKSIPVAKGETILSALKKSGIYLVASCGGKGTCGKCRIKIHSGKYRTSTSRNRVGTKRRALSLPAKHSLKATSPQRYLKRQGSLSEIRLRLSKSNDLSELLRSFDKEITPIVKRLNIKLPPPTIEDHISDLERLKRELEMQGIKGMRFSQTFISSMADGLRKHNWEIHLAYVDGPEAIFVTSEKQTSRYGIAVDIGTTTIVVYLIDLADGKLVDVGSTYNSQIRYGDDVITRIVHATEGGGLEELRGTVTADINNIAEAMIERHGINKEYIECAVISGNTTMSHIFWGLDPGHIREEPYIPTVNSFPLWKAGTARLQY